MNTVNRIQQLNRWLQLYDLEVAKSRALAVHASEVDAVPTWYHKRAHEWMEERDLLVSPMWDEYMGVGVEHGMGW